MVSQNGQRKGQTPEGTMQPVGALENFFYGYKKKEEGPSESREGAA